MVQELGAHSRSPLPMPINGAATWRGHDRRGVQLSRHKRHQTRHGEQRCCSQCEHDPRMGQGVIATEPGGGGRLVSDDAERDAAFAAAAYEAAFTAAVARAEAAAAEYAAP